MVASDYIQIISTVINASASVPNSFFPWIGFLQIIIIPPIGAHVKGGLLRSGYVAWQMGWNTSGNENTIAWAAKRSIDRSRAGLGLAKNNNSYCLKQVDNKCETLIRRKKKPQP